MLCSNIYPYKTYPHISPVKHPIIYSPYSLYEAHRPGQSQPFTPRVYESGNSPDLRDRHHIHQMVTSASSTSGSSRPSDQVWVHRHQWNSWDSKKRKLRGCVFPQPLEDATYPSSGRFGIHWRMSIYSCPSKSTICSLLLAPKLRSRVYAICFSDNPSVSICPLLWQRDVKLQQTNQLTIRRLGSCPLHQFGQCYKT